MEISEMPPTRLELMTEESLRHHLAKMEGRLVAKIFAVGLAATAIVLAAFVLLI